MRSRLLAVALVALVFPQAAFARGEFDPVVEFEQHDWVPIHLGPLDLSITKAVVYLMHRDRPDDLHRNLPDAGAGARRRRAGGSADDR